MKMAAIFPGGSGATLTGITVSQLSDANANGRSLIKSNYAAQRDLLGIKSDLCPWLKDSTIGYCAAGGTSTSYAVTKGLLIAYPQRLPTCSLNSLVTLVTTAGDAGSTLRFGLATPASDNRPGVLIADYGTVAADTTGSKTISFGSATSITNGTKYGLVLKDGGTSSANISAGTWSHGDGDLGAVYNAGTPSLFGISWLFLVSQSGALSSDYSASTWLHQGQASVPRVMYRT